MPELSNRCAIINLRDCTLHSEQYSINKTTAAAICNTKKRGGRIIAIGTTALRALESSALQNGGEVCAGNSETDLFIRPGFVFSRGGYVADKLSFAAIVFVDIGLCFWRAGAGFGCLSPRR